MENHITWLSAGAKVIILAAGLTVTAVANDVVKTLNTPSNPSSMSKDNIDDRNTLRKALNMPKEKTSRENAIEEREIEAAMVSFRNWEIPTISITK